MGTDLDAILNSEIGQPMVHLLFINSGVIAYCPVGANLLPKFWPEGNAWNMGSCSPRAVSIQFTFIIKVLILCQVHDGFQYGMQINKMPELCD